MSKNSTKQKIRLFVCRNGCLCVLATSILLLVIAHQVSARISESTIFFEAENISLLHTYERNSLRGDKVLQDEMKNTYFRGRDIRTLLGSVAHNQDSDNIALVMSGYNPRIQPNGRIILRESDDYIVFIEQVWVRACFISINVNPYKQFQNKSRFTFYKIHKEVMKDKSYKVKTEFLGSIDTNIYGAWRGNTKKISISPDGKYIVMNAYTVNSRSLGEFRNREVLLIWEIGDNVVEKDIVDGTGKKISIVIKTEEEMERR